MRPTGCTSLAHRVLLILVLIALPIPTFAQNTLSDVLGIPPDAAIYPIPGVGFVNLSNGNLHIQIPIRVVKDRNGTPLTTSFTYDNSVWQTIQVPSQSGGSVSEWTAGTGADEFTTLSVSTSPNYFGQATNTATTVSCGNSSGQQYAYWSYTDGNGTTHPFPTDLLTAGVGLSACTASTAQAAATDGSGYWLEVTNGSSALVYDMHGNIVTYGGTDTNGNGANLGRGGYVDILGRSLPIRSGRQSDAIRQRCIPSVQLHL